MTITVSADGEAIPHERIQQHISLLNEGISRDKVLQFLDDLPSDTHPDFYRQLTRLLDIDSQSHLEEELLEILNADSLDTERDQEDIQFAALYYLKTYYRRNLNTRECAQFYESYEERFGHRIMYEFGQVIIDGLKGEYETALRKNRTIIEELDKNKDVLHEFPNNVAEGYEENELPESKRTELLREAVQIIDRVLNLDQDYGRYHFTKGRLMKLQGNFRRARNLIEQAIEKERPERFDYGMRISMYQMHLSQVYASEYRAELESQLNNAKENIENTRQEAEDRIDEVENRVIQFLGFFSGILAIIITSAQIGTQFSFQQATQFIGLLTGGLLISFSGLGLLLPTNKTVRKIIASIIIFLMGLTMFAISIVLFPNLLT